jgi:hypothetical protein
MGFIFLAFYLVNPRGRSASLRDLYSNKEEIMETPTLQIILDAIQAISTRLELLKHDKYPVYCSEETHELATSLAKAHMEMALAEKTSENSFFHSKYADFSEVVRASRPTLSKNGISVPQVLLDYNDASWLISRMTHTSGQWIESRIRIKPPKGDIQEYGKMVTYLKRYSYGALTGVVSGDEDDDGESAVAETREVFAKGTALNKDYKPKNAAISISRDQYDELELELRDHDDIAEKILDHLQLRNLMDLPKEKFRYTIDRVRSIKHTRSGKK